MDITETIQFQNRSITLKAVGFQTGKWIASYEDQDLWHIVLNDGHAKFYDSFDEAIQDMKDKFK